MPDRGLQIATHPGREDRGQRKPELLLGDAGTEADRRVNHHRLAGGVALVLAVGWSFLASGLVAWRLRPDNPIGPAMVACQVRTLMRALSESAGRKKVCSIPSLSKTRSSRNSSSPFPDTVSTIMPRMSAPRSE